MKLSFLIANIIRSPSDSHASVLSKYGLLDRYVCGTRNFTQNIDPEKQTLLPKYGIFSYLAAKTLPPYYGESFRFALCPMFEREVLKMMDSGTNIICGLGYLNKCIEKTRKSGGISFLDARNSHPSSFWNIMAEEHARWDCNLPPIFPNHHLRQLRSVEVADYFFVPSKFVANSFLKAGVSQDKILHLPYPIDLSLFRPPNTIRPKTRPLTIVCSGGSSFRKGTLDLLAAFKLVLKQVPDARLKLVGGTPPQLQLLYKKLGYDKLPIEFSSYMNHSQLVNWLHDADVYVLPTLEEGMVRSAAEAMACGLPVITTDNSGINDFIKEGVNGSVIPIRDPQATSDSILSWWLKILNNEYLSNEVKTNNNELSFESFSGKFTNHLRSCGIQLPF